MRGSARASRWQRYERNVLADDQRVFGEAPGHIIGVGVLTDADALKIDLQAWYGAITLTPPDARARRVGSGWVQAGRYGGLAQVAGSTRLTASPGWALRKTRLPPWELATRWHSDKPSPTPPLARVRAASGR